MLITGILVRNWWPHSEEWFKKNTQWSPIKYFRLNILSCFVCFLFVCFCFLFVFCFCFQLPWFFNHVKHARVSTSLHRVNNTMIGYYKITFRCIAVHEPIKFVYQPCQIPYFVESEQNACGYSYDTCLVWIAPRNGWLNPDNYLAHEIHVIDEFIW